MVYFFLFKVDYPPNHDRELQNKANAVLQGDSVQSRTYNSSKSQAPHKDDVAQGSTSPISGFQNSDYPIYGKTEIESHNSPEYIFQFQVVHPEVEDPRQDQFRISPVNKCGHNNNCGG